MGRINLSHMNWGWKLTLAYLGFATMIMTLVFKARSEKIDLVAPDYYAQEIAYQGRINAIKRTSALSDSVAHALTSEGIEVTFPADCKGRFESGEIRLYRPSDAGLDQSFPITSDFQGVFVIPSQSLKTGYYLVQSSWKMNGQEYYSEESILIK
jgi:hypothetical protein